MAMNIDQPGGAARFAISIDGMQIGRFAYLATETVAGGARNIEPHELTPVMQQQGSTVRKSLGRTKWPLITLKRGVVEPAALGPEDLDQQIGCPVQHLRRVAGALGDFGRIRKRWPACAAAGRAPGSRQESVGGSPVAWEPPPRSGRPR